MAKRGGLLIVDGAFVDLMPDLSVTAPLTAGLLVLRSFGKFFGLAGLRLGFAVCAPDMAKLLREALGPWPVSGPALEIGRIALADRAWIDAMRIRLAREAAFMDAVLAQGGLAILGGTSLFRLAGASRAWALFEYLGQARDSGAPIPGATALAPLRPGTRRTGAPKIGHRSGRLDRPDYSSGIRSSK